MSVDDQPAAHHQSLRAWALGSYQPLRDTAAASRNVEPRAVLR